MNLDRISIKMGGANTSYMSLAKISDFSKLYTTILFIEKSSPQKINTGDSIQAFNFKNIEQFKGLRPFNAYTQEQLLFLYNQYGSDFLYQTKLHSGDLVRYNGLKYVVLGIVVNTYAQWNMPTPLLFNPTNVNNDYKSLYGSRLTEEQINSKINDNFQAGKYDIDMIIPLVDANDFSEQITVLQPRPTKEEAELMFDSVKAEKDLTIKSQKDVFIDTMLRLRGNEINKIKEVNEDLFKGVQTLLLSVNKAVNEQIALLPEPAKEKPVRKPREKKVVEEVEPVIDLLKDKFDVMSVSYFKEKFKNTFDLYEHLKDILKNKETKGAFDLPIYVEYSDDGDYKSKNIHIEATNIEPEGYEFNFETMSRRDFLEMFMIQHPEYDWAKFDGYVEVEPIVEEDKFAGLKRLKASVEGNLPDFIAKYILVEDLPEPVKKLVIFRNKQEDKFAISLSQTISNAFDWENTPEGGNFWNEINSKGDLREFKKLYGNKGEKVDELIEFEDLTKFVETEIMTKEPVEETQKVIAVAVIFYPPSGGVLELKTYSIIELSALTTEMLNILKVKTLLLNFKAIVSGITYTTQIFIKSFESYSEILENLIKQYDTFVKPELDWSDFSEKKPDVDRVSLNNIILTDAFMPKPKPVQVEKPKPVPVEKPKPVKVVAPKVITPKPIKAVAPKVVAPKVIAPKPAKVVAPKVVKTKAVKTKVEDDLSFLDDLDNIF
jgi:hypothetical protein